MDSSSLTVDIYSPERAACLLAAELQSSPGEQQVFASPAPSAFPYPSQV